MRAFIPAADVSSWGRRAGENVDWLADNWALLITTLIATALWALVYAVAVSGWVSFREAG